MLIKLNEMMLTRLGLLVMTSVFILKSAKLAKRKAPLLPRFEQVTDLYGVTRNCKFLGMTSREIEVTILLCQELRHREIADRLFISARTVDKHVENIFCKTDVTSRSDLVRMVQDNNFTALS